MKNCIQQYMIDQADKTYQSYLMYTVYITMLNIQPFLRSIYLQPTQI